VSASTSDWGQAGTTLRDSRRRFGGRAVLPVLVVAKGSSPRARLIHCASGGTPYSMRCPSFRWLIEYSNPGAYPCRRCTRWPGPGTLSLTGWGCLWVFPVYAVFIGRCHSRYEGAIGWLYADAQARQTGQCGHGQIAPLASGPSLYRRLYDGGQDRPSLVGIEAGPTTTFL
jgi:hypothetical protein